MNKATVSNILHFMNRVPLGIDPKVGTTNEIQAYIEAVRALETYQRELDKPQTEFIPPIQDEI